MILVIVTVLVVNSANPQSLYGYRHINTENIAWYLLADFIIQRYINAGCSSIIKIGYDNNVWNIICPWRNAATKINIYRYWERCLMRNGRNFNNF